MNLQMQLVRGVMALALILGAGGLAAMAPAQPQRALACPTTVAPESGDEAIVGFASLMAPKWRAHLPALIGRRSV
jgi:hypothetical protein